MRTVIRPALAIAPALLLGACGLASSTTPPNAQAISRPGVVITAAQHAQTPETTQITNPTPRAAASPQIDAEELPGATRVSFAEEGGDFDPVVSPDGDTLIFASTQHSAHSDLYSKRIASRVVTRLTSNDADDEMPAISPDGAWIAFSSNRAGNWDIFVMPSQGGPAVQITSESADEIHPSWSADGRTLAFNRRATDGRWEMWTALVASPATPTYIGEGLFPQWCPAAASNRLLYQLPRERGRHAFALWTLEVRDGSAFNQTEIASSANAAFINPAWSTDGAWIAFAQVSPDGSENLRPTPSSRSSLWMVSADGATRLRLTGDGSLNVHPTWSSKGDLFFVSTRSGAMNIWSLPAAEETRTARGISGQGASPVLAGASESSSSHPEPHPSADNMGTVTAGAPDGEY